MQAVLEVHSTLTDRHQTTIPTEVRKALDLEKKDRICYKLNPSGEVVLAKAVSEDADPAIEAFLGFLQTDMVKNPARLQAFGEGLAARLTALTDGIDVDLDAPLSPDDE